MRPFLIWLLLCLSSWIPSLVWAGEPLTLLGTLPHDKRHPANFQGFDLGQVVFTRWNAAGNTFDLVAWDLQTRSTTALAPGRQGDARLLARTNDLILISERGELTLRISALERASGRTVGRVGLNSGLVWSHAQGRELLASQAQGEGLVLDLPSLRVKKRVALPGHVHAATWGEKVVLLGQSLSIYDAQWNSVGEVHLPPPGGRGNCPPGPLVVAGDKAVLGLHCGDILVVDLPSRTIERRIAGSSMFASFVVVDGLLLRVNADLSRQPHQATAYDLATGEDLGPLPLKATELHSDGTHLVAVNSTAFLARTAAILKVDAKEIRSRRWSLAQVAAHCSVAPRVDEDPYPFLDACEAAGIHSLSSSPFADQIRPQLAAYTSGLATARDRASEPRRLPPATPTPVTFQPGVDMLYRAGGQLFASHWRCGIAGSEGVGVTAHDLVTLAQQAEAKLADCDSGDDGEIVSMAADERHLYVAMQLHAGPHPSNFRTDLYILDRHTLAFVDAGKFEEDLGLIAFQEGTLFGCACEGLGGDGACRKIETRPLASAPDTRHQCAGLQEGTTPFIEPRRPVPTVGTPIGLDGEVALTRSFIVRSVRSGEYSNPLELLLEPRGRAGARRSLRIERAIGWLASQDTDRVLVSRAMGETQRLLSIDLADGKEQTLGHYRSGPLMLALGGRHAYVATEYDLQAIDMETGRLHASWRNIVDPALAGSGIVRLLLDRDRLIILTANGAGTRTLSLHGLERP